MLMLIVAPFLRLPEAFLRMRFLSGHYGSFWESLKSDWFFSDGWFEYIRTPLGLWYNVFILAWTVLAGTMIASSFYRWHLEDRKLQREMNANAEQDAGGDSASRSESR